MCSCYLCDVEIEAKVEEGKKKEKLYQEIRLIVRRREKDLKHSEVSFRDV